MALPTDLQTPIASKRELCAALNKVQDVNNKSIRDDNAIMQKKKGHGRKSKEEQGEHWGHRLASVLKEKNLSNRATAKLLGVAPSLIDAWSKKGSSPADLKIVKKLADSLNIDFTWLLTGERDQKQPQVTIAELFKDTELFDGIVRLRVDKLTPRSGQRGSEGGSK